MKININGKTIPTSEQGFLLNPDNWSEPFVEKLASEDHVDLHVDHWELIYYFRDYYYENLTHPSMHQLIMSLGKRKNQKFHDYKSWEKHIYKLFPNNPINELCKLAGLPMPPPDT